MASGKYFTPFDKALFELFSDDDKKDDDKEEFVPKFMGDVPSELLEKEPQNQGQKDAVALGADNYFELDDGTLTTNSSDPETQRKIKERNSPELVTLRLMEKDEREEPAEPISLIEEIVLGTSPLDAAKDVSTLDRIKSKVGENILRGTEESARGAAAGLVRGTVVIPQILDAVNKYGFGTLEQGTRWAFGDGFVDYDKLVMANTPTKAVAEESEKFIKSVDASLGVKDLNTSAKILMYVTDFAVPINIPGKVIKATKMIGNVTSDTYKALTNTTPYFQKSPGFQPIDPMVKSLRENVNMGSLKNDLKKATVDKNYAKATELNERILQRRASILKSSMKNIKDIDSGIGYKGWKIENYGEGRFDFGFKRTRPAGARRSVMAADYRVPLEDTYYGGVGKAIAGAKPQLTERLVFETYDPQQKAFRETYKKLMQGQSVISAGAIAGTWDSYFEGTEYRDLSYLMGLTSIFANPTSTMRLVDAIGNIAFGTKYGKSLQDIKIPWGKGIDDAGMEVDRALSLPSLVHGVGKFLAERKLKDGETIDLNTAVFAKKARAMAMGVPFYKVMFSDKSKIFGKDGLDLGVDATTPINAQGMTELDALTAFSTKELRTLEKFSSKLMQNLPEEYIKSHELLVKIGLDNAERLRNSPYGDKTSEFVIALDQLAAGVRMNAFGGLLNQTYKNSELSGGLFGSKNRDSETILNIFRTHQQELQDQVGYIKGAMEDLVGGFGKTSNEFQDLKRGADKIVAKLNSNIQDFSDEIGALSAQAKITGSTNQQQADKLITDADTGFNLRMTHGVGLEDQPNGMQALNNAEKAFGNRINQYVGNAYEQAVNTKNARFDEMDEVLQGKVLDAEDYIDELEKLKGQQIEEIGNIADILKNPTQYKAFGSLTGDIQDPIKYTNDIDTFIRFSRYKGLEDKPLDKMKDTLNSIIDDGLDVELVKGSKLPVSFDDSNKLSLEITLDNISIHAKDRNLSEEEYLRTLLSSIVSKDKGDVLNQEFTHKMNASDMHTIRKNHSDFAWKTRFTKPKASQALYNSSKKLDEIFTGHDIKEVAEANKEYTNFKRTWHESFLGKKLLQTVDEQVEGGVEEFTRNIDSQRDLLAPFLQAKDPAQSRKLLDELFSNFKDSNQNIISMENIRKQILDDLDSTFGFEIIQGRMFRGNYQTNISKISSLLNNKLISKGAADKAKAYLQLIDKNSVKNVTKEIDNATNNLDTALKRMTKVQLDNIKESIGADVKNINDTSQLFDFLFPPSKTDTYARQAVGASDEVTSPFEKVKSLAEKKSMEIKEAGYEPEMDVSAIQKNFDETFPVKDREEITGSRFDVFLKELFGVSNQDIITRNISSGQKKQLESFRDVLVSTLIKKSQNITSTRKAMLDLSTQDTLNKDILGTTEDVGRARAFLNNKLISEGTISTKPSAFKLDDDINIVDMMTMYENMKPSLVKIDDAVGKNQSFVSDLEMMFDNLIAIKGEVPDLVSGDFSSIPRALTTSAALSRIYSGMRGVVSWRYLATEQIVREQQRSKHIMLHTIMSDPDFIRNLGLIIDNKPIKDERNFVSKILGIMTKPAFSRAVTYDPDKENSRNYDPNPNEIVKFLRSFFNVRYLQEEGLDIPFTDTTVPLLGFNEPKDITEGELSVFEDEDVFGGSVIPFGLTRQRTLGDDEIDIDDLEQDPTISIEQEGNIDKGDTSEEEFYKRIGL